MPLEPGVRPRPEVELEIEDVIKAVEGRRRLVEGVLSEYLSFHECPCRWPQFVSRMGKEQGPGWQDEIQNHLVEAALKLKSYVKVRPADPEFWLEAILHCTKCGSKWKYFSEEWRMSAFRMRLLRTDGDRGDPAGAGMISSFIFATVGFEPPDDTPMLSLEEWANYMLGRLYRTEPYRSAVRTDG